MIQQGSGDTHQWACGVLGGIDEIRTRLLRWDKEEEWKCYVFDKVHSQINEPAQIRDDKAVEKW